jgi:thermitase
MNRRIKTVLTISLAVLLAAAQSQFTTTRITKADDAIDASAQGVSLMSRMKPESVPGRLLVKYRRGVSSRRRNNLMNAAGARSDREIPGLGVHIVDLPEGADQEAFAKVLRTRSEVEFAEPDYIVYPVSEMVPDDPLYSSQWHLPAIACPAAWGMTSGSDQVTIALCDTGVDSSHPDLSTKLVPGWNVVDNNSDTSPVAPHGTWTAGTAAATGNNAVGVASPALNCRIMPVRVSSLASGGAMVSDLALGVTWAADHGARVASVSYMAGGSNLMGEVGKYIQSKGGVLVVAAGNTGTYNSVPNSPSIIVVGATTQTDELAGYTTTGTYVDLSAPGSGILTTAPGGGYQSVSGTSFSAPLVAGAAALMFSINPNLTSAQLDTILKVTADDLGPPGWDPGYGWGRLNAGSAIDVVQRMINGTSDATPPALGFLQPQIGGAEDGLIGTSGGELVRVNALDDRDVTAVSLFADGTLLGTDTSEPYAFYWNTSTFGDGSQHTLTAAATDQAGNTTSISTAVTIRAGFDATPPSVGFVQPQANGQIGISPSASIQISATDNSSVTSVSLVADGVLLGAYTAGPYTFTWNTSSFAIGSQHTLIAVAGDQANNSASASITVTAVGSRDATRPSVSFLQPKNGGQVGKSQGEIIKVNASDTTAVASVSLYADGNPVGVLAASPYTFAWDTSSLAAGSKHKLTAVAADQAGNSASVSITVTVKATDTTSPKVSFLSPKNGELVKAEVKVNVTATDNVAVTRVDFYADNKLFESRSKTPYSVKWKTNGIAKGAHTLKCIAYDAAGNSATTSISVTVR